MNTTHLKISGGDFGLLAAENLTKGVSIRFKANGCSMYPSIHNSDIISVAPINKNNLKWGDIILYRINGTNNLIAHRIIFIKNHTVYTRGDALGGDFEQVAANDVLGRVFKIEHNGSVLKTGKITDRTKGILRAIRQSLRHRFFKYFPRNNSK